MAKKFILTPTNDGVLHTRNIILRGICAVYLCAFAAFYYQSPGLFGKNGILPAYIQFSSYPKGLVSAIHKNPTLLHFAQFLGLDTDLMMDILSLFGILISFTGFISQAFCLLPTFAALWSLYFSLVQVTQVFGQQSDQLLLEAGFLCLILAPLNNSKKSTSSDKIGIAMLKWLLFRFMFDSGAVKFFSGCPQWWKFSGLAYHFETMPLPTALSWFCYYNIPALFMKAVNIYTNLSELVCPWFFFFPSRAVRIILFYWELYLQFCIILTGNYGFLNFLLIVLLITLLDDQYIKSRSIKRLIFEALVAFLIFTVLFHKVPDLFSSEIEKLAFRQEHIAVLRSMTKLSPLLPLVAVIATFLTNLVSHPAIIDTGKGFLRKLSDINTLLAVSLVSLLLVGVSVVPHNNLDSAMNITNTQLGKYYKMFNKYRIVNEFGQHLGKMRTERFEITLEYAQDINKAWNEIKFAYKPSDIKNPSSFLGPYLPRLDMKFYDAATGNYRENTWLLPLVYRILQNEPMVLKLLGIDNKIEPTPKYVRAILNKFKFTTSIDNPGYWRRKILGEYFPAFSIDNPTLGAYLQSYKLEKFKSPHVQNVFLKQILDMIRQQVMTFEGHTFVLAVLLAGYIIVLLKK